MSSSLSKAADQYLAQDRNPLSVGIKPNLLTMNIQTLSDEQLTVLLDKDQREELTKERNRRIKLLKSQGLTHLELARKFNLSIWGVIKLFRPASSVDKSKKDGLALSTIEE